MEPCCAVCFLGCTPKCLTPSVDVQSVPRFTPLEHYGSQVHQKENHQHLLLWEVSVMQQCLSDAEAFVFEKTKRVLANIFVLCWF